MNSQKWLKAAHEIDADIAHLKAASEQYKHNAEKNIPFPHDEEDDTISSLTSDESQQPQVSSAPSHARTAK
jgi:hypothetical protein